MDRDVGVLLRPSRSSVSKCFRCPTCGSGTDALFATRGREPPTVPISEHWFDKALMILATGLTVSFGCAGLVGFILALLTIVRSETW